MTKRLDAGSETTTMTFKLPSAMVGAIDRVRGQVPRSAWIREAVEGRLGLRQEPLYRPRSDRATVPMGGQDAASGAGVEARAEEPYRTLTEIRADQPPAVARRERPRCDPGRHPVGSKIGRACGACGQEDAWTK